MVKKLTALLGLAAVFALNAVHAEPLQQKIADIDEFAADFLQQVKDKEGQVLSEAQGRLALKKPRSFMLHTQGLDELYLYTRTDGVYYYDPFVNQLTILPLAALDKTPFALLLSEDKAVWDSYQIEELKEGALYRIAPASGSESADFERIELAFSGRYLSAITVWFKDGNVNSYDLRAQRFAVVPDAFEVDVPRDAEIADER